MNSSFDNLGRCKSEYIPGLERRNVMTSLILKEQQIKYYSKHFGVLPSLRNEIDFKSFLTFNGSKTVLKINPLQISYDSIILVI